MAGLDIKGLQSEYEALSGAAERLRQQLVTQLDFILRERKIYLAFPIESRVKTWASLSEKLERRSLELSSITSLHDLIGLRVVLLFRRDLPTVGKIVDETFKVISKEDTAGRLTEKEFGYSSFHYIISVPSEWSSVPTLSGLGDFKAEVQIRTAAQHIWAASSHVLQYKQESSVPDPVKRSIYRVSALLETVDLEFERVLSEKDAYRAKIASNEKEDLNVDSLEQVLDATWPVESKIDGEPYSELLQDLLAMDIRDTDALSKLLKARRNEVLKDDSEQIDTLIRQQRVPTRILERVNSGVFRTHVGLTRATLAREFGDRWTQYKKTAKDKWSRFDGTWSIKSK